MAEKKQKIFTVNDLVNYVKDVIRKEDEYETYITKKNIEFRNQPYHHYCKIEYINVAFKPACILMKNEYEKNVVYCNPINIKVVWTVRDATHSEWNDRNSLMKCTTRVDLIKEFGNDVALKFNMRKDTKIYEDVQMNILRIMGYECHYKDKVYHKYSVNGLKHDLTCELYKNLFEAHKDDKPFTFRKREEDDYDDYIDYSDCL